MANELIPVAFHGDTIDAVQTDTDERPYASVRRLCENLRINFDAQRVKLQNCGWARVLMIKTHDSLGRSQDQFCICVDDIPKWLSEIDINRVGTNLDPGAREALRHKLLVYQQECATVLRDYFFGRTPTDPILAILEQTKLIRLQQIEHDRRLTNMEREVAQARTEARAALADATDRYGLHSILGWARRHGREITMDQAARLDAALVSICRRTGIFTGQMCDPRLGIVNTFPASLLRQYLGDDDEPIPDALIPEEPEP